MQLTSRFRIKNIKNIANFLDEVHVGRLSTIDENGYPQIIPMNFVHFATKIEDNYKSNFTHQVAKEIDQRIEDNSDQLEIENIKDNDGIDNKKYRHLIYIHSHHKGEKIENILRNQKVGFEADKEICFLPSYYFHPTDASFADTLYTSIVVKGKASIVSDNKEKTLAMNKMMQKYQSEGRYSLLTPDSKSIIYLTVIKIDVETIEGKFKIGQEWSSSFKKDIAKKIIEREGNIQGRKILKDMKINIMDDGELELPFSTEM